MVGYLYYCIFQVTTTRQSLCFFFRFVFADFTILNVAEIIGGLTFKKNYDQLSIQYAQIETSQNKTFSNLYNLTENLYNLTEHFYNLTGKKQL